MRRLTVLVVLLLTTISLISAQATDPNIEHTKWIASVMDSIQTIKPGMTREVLLKMFATEGGLSNRSRRTYVYKQCPYIKVSIEFEPAENATGVSIEMPQDKITKISAPFLQYTIAD